MRELMTLDKIDQIIQVIIQHETGVPHRINHFLKVYGFAKAIGEQEGIDHQVLVGADFLVNIYEKEMKKDQIRFVRNKIFKTKTGLEYLDRMFL